MDDRDNRNLRIRTFGQKLSYDEYLCRRNDSIQLEQESINILNQIYRLNKIPIKISMTVMNKDLVDNQITDLQETKSTMTAILTRTANTDIEVYYNIRVFTPIRRVIEDMRRYLKSDIDKCIKVYKSKETNDRRLFALDMKNINDQAVIDDIIDAIYVATDNEIDRRHKKKHPQ